MCGIIAFLHSLSTRSNIDNKGYDILLRGLLELQNRGYDSVGISLFLSENDQHYLWKRSSVRNRLALDILSKELPKSIIWERSCRGGIAHTRWATHGPKTDENAHPHKSESGDVLLIHNGIIENYKELLIKGNRYLSQTDTEVVAHYLAEGIPETNDLTVITHYFSKRLQDVRGTWAFILQHKRFPGVLWVMKHGSPLCVSQGQNDGDWYLGSEPTALPVKKYYSIPDSTIFMLNDSSSELLVVIENVVERMDWKEYIRGMDMKVRYDYDDAKLKEGEHWMLREIMEQPEVIRRALNYGGRVPTGVNQWVHLGGLVKIRLPENFMNVCLIGCGTSLYAAQWGGYWMRKLLHLRVTVVDASEWDNDQWARIDTLYIYLSQSGETKDVHRALMSLNTIGEFMRIGVINAVESLIARDLGQGVYCNAGTERAVASTKSFTSQCIILGLILMWLYERTYKDSYEMSRNQVMCLWKESLLGLADVVEHWLSRDVMREQIRRIAKRIYKNERCFCLGRSSMVPIAYEAALKIKEVSYMHAEGFVGGALKHGPFSLLEEGTPVILLSSQGADGDESVRRQLIVAEEVKARGAYVIWISDTTVHRMDEEIIVPGICGKWCSLISIIPIQLLAYEMALLKEIHPDYPRNLAKVVTVD